MVAKGNRSAPETWLFLKPPRGPNADPEWTNIKSGAGIWSEVDAKTLAGLHSGMSPSGNVSDA